MAGGQTAALTRADYAGWLTFDDACCSVSVARVQLARLLDGEAIREVATGAADELGANACWRDRKLQESKRRIVATPLERREVACLRVAPVLTVNPDSAHAHGRDYGACTIRELIVDVHHAVRVERPRSDARAIVRQSELLAAGIGVVGGLEIEV